MASSMRIQTVEQCVCVRAKINGQHRRLSLDWRRVKCLPKKVATASFLSSFAPFLSRLLPISMMTCAVKGRHSLLSSSSKRDFFPFSCSRSTAQDSCEPKKRRNLIKCISCSPAVLTEHSIFLKSKSKNFLSFFRHKDQQLSLRLAYATVSMLVFDSILSSFILIPLFLFSILLSGSVALLWFVPSLTGPFCVVGKRYYRLIKYAAV